MRKARWEQICYTLEQWTSVPTLAVSLSYIAEAIGSLLITEEIKDENKLIFLPGAMLKLIDFQFRRWTKLA